MPKSWSGKRRAAALSGELRPTTRPDVDNYVKAALDAINEIVVRDDSLVVELTAAKRYATSPRLTITVAPVLPLTVQPLGRDNRGKPIDLAAGRPGSSMAA